MKVVAITREWHVDRNLYKAILIGQFTMVFSLMDPKERMKSSHCTLVGSPILLVGVARRSYDLNIWSIIFKSASRSWLFTDLERKKSSLFRKFGYGSILDPENELSFKIIILKTFTLKRFCFCGKFASRWCTFSWFPKGEMYLTVVNLVN